MRIHQLLETFRSDLETAINEDSKKWLPDQEAHYLHAENILEHIEYILDWDPTGDTPGDWKNPSDWVPEGEGV